MRSAIGSRGVYELPKSRLGVHSGGVHVRTRTICVDASRGFVRTLRLAYKTEKRVSRVLTAAALLLLSLLNPLVAMDFAKWRHVRESLQLCGGEHAILCNGQMGDVFVTLAFERSFCKCHELRNVRLLMTPPQSDLAELFGLSQCAQLFTSLPSRRINAWLALSTKSGATRVTPIDTGPLVGLSYMACGAVSRVDFVRAHLGLSTRVEMSAPTVSESARDSVARMFELFGLSPGQTVILAPCSKTLRAVALDWWIELSRQLRSEGYCVATNISRGDPCVPGTTPLPLHLKEAQAAAELAGWVISSRSGMCDLLSFAECRLTVIYSEQVAQRWVAFHSMSRSRGHRPTLEIHLRDSQGSETFREILTFGGSIPRLARNERLH